MQSCKKTEDELLILFYLASELDQVLILDELSSLLLTCERWVDLCLTYSHTAIQALCIEKIAQYDCAPEYWESLYFRSNSALQKLSFEKRVALLVA